MLLHDARVDINLSDHENYHPLNRAVINGWNDVVERILASGRRPIEGVEQALNWLNIKTAQLQNQAVNPYIDLISLFASLYPRSFGHCNRFKAQISSQ